MYLTYFPVMLGSSVVSSFCAVFYIIYNILYAGQIFECLRETFYRQTCLGVSAVASFRENSGGKCFPTQTPDILWSFNVLWSVGTRFRHLRQS